jgi:hypothetical protein
VQALSQFGTDFTLICHLFPGRQRRHLKNKVLPMGLLVLVLLPLLHWQFRCCCGSASSLLALPLLPERPTDGM